MRRALAILLFAITSYQCILKLSIVAWYECNKSYIAQHLCENRDKPQMKCCGKCYLKKQLARADNSNREGKPLAEHLSKIEIPAFILPGQIILVRHFAEQNKPGS